MALHVTVLFLKPFFLNLGNVLDARRSWWFGLCFAVLAGLRLAGWFGLSRAGWTGLRLVRW